MDQRPTICIYYILTLNNSPFCPSSIHGRLLLNKDNWLRRRLNKSWEKSPRQFGKMQQIDVESTLKIGFDFARSQYSHLSLDARAIIIISYYFRFNPITHNKYGFGFANIGRDEKENGVDGDREREHKLYQFVCYSKWQTLKWAANNKLSSRFDCCEEV